MSSSALRHTALDALHRSLGATMTDFAGWDMPLRYGSERDEHNAVRTAPASSTSRTWARSRSPARAPPSC
ncbi:Aminomethyltransferase [Streptomyces glaucescens]